MGYLEMDKKLEVRSRIVLELSAIFFGVNWLVCTILAPENSGILDMEFKDNVQQKT